MVFGVFPSSPSLIPVKVSHEVLRSGGCGEFSCELLPTENAPASGDPFLVYQNSAPVYSGTIMDIQGTEESGYRVKGFNNTLHSVFFPPDLRIPPMTEAASWFQLRSIIEAICEEQGVNVYDVTSPNLTMSIIKTMGTVDLSGKSLFDGLNEFALRSSTPISWGVDPFNRLYVLALSDAINGSFHRSLQGSDRYVYSAAAMTKSRGVFFTGSGQQTYPPVHSNATFDDLDSRFATMRHSLLNLFSNGTTGGVYNDAIGSGDTGSGQWALFDGASVRTFGTTTTQKVRLLDNINERMVLTNAFQYFAFQANKSYVLQYDGIAEALVGSINASIQSKITFNGSGTTHTLTTVFTAQGMKQVRHSFIVPPSTTTIDLEIRMVGGGGGTDKGVGICHAKVFPDNEPFPVNWDVVVPRNSVNAQVADYHVEQGALYINSVVGAGANDYVMLRYKEPSQVTPFLQYKWILRIKGKTGTAWPNVIYVTVDGYDKDGNFVSTYTSPVIAIAQPTNYVNISNTLTMPSNVVSAIMAVRIAKSGTVIIDGFVMRDSRETSAEVYGDTLFYRKIFTPATMGGIASLSAEAGTIKEADDYIEAWKATQNQYLPSPDFDEEIGIDLNPYTIFGKPCRESGANIFYPIESIKVDAETQRLNWKLNVRPRTLEDFVAKKVKTSSAI